MEVELLVVVLDVEVVVVLVVVSRRVVVVLELVELEVEVVDVERELSLGRRIDTEVAQVRVAAELAGKTRIRTA